MSITFPKCKIAVINYNDLFYLLKQSSLFSNKFHLLTQVSLSPYRKTRCTRWRSCFVPPQRPWWPPSPGPRGTGTGPLPAQWDIGGPPVNIVKVNLLYWSDGPFCSSLLQVYCVLKEGARAFG